MADSPLIKQQTHAITDYLNNGFKHPCGQCIGFELEHFVVHEDTLEPVPFIVSEKTQRLEKEVAPLKKAIPHRLQPQECNKKPGKT